MNWLARFVAFSSTTILVLSTVSCNEDSGQSVLDQSDRTTKTNIAPVVNAGVDQVIVLPDDTVFLNGTVTDDDLPSNSLSSHWEVDGDPGTVTFAQEFSPQSNATFSVAGTYTLRLNADDGELESSDMVIVTIRQATAVTSITVAPSSVTLSFGETIQFTASGFDQTNANIPINPSWSSTGGPIDNAGLYTADNAIGNFQITATDNNVTGSATVIQSGSSGNWPTQGWPTATPTEMGMDQSLLEQARDYALTGNGSGIITRSGKVVMAWGSQTARYDLKSTTKSIGVTALGVALSDNLIMLDDLAQSHLADIGVPPASNQTTGWPDQITMLNLATHAGGFDKPGGFINLLFQPGSTWSYSDGGANWLADVLTVSFDSDLNDLMFTRVFNNLGITSSDLRWRDNAHRDDTINGIKRREFGSGISANVDAMARIGYLYLRRGGWESQQILPESFVNRVSVPESSISGLPVNDTDAHASASNHYGLLWWNNGDDSMPQVPPDAYWSWGLFDSFIIVIPSLDIVVARAGDGWRSGWDSNYAVIAPFIEPIALSVTGSPMNQRR